MGVLEGLADVRFGSLVDILAVNCDVRFTPESGHSAVQDKCPLSANRGHSLNYLVGAACAGATANRSTGSANPLRSRLPYSVKRMSAPATRSFTVRMRSSSMTRPTRPLPSPGGRSATLRLIARAGPDGRFAPVGSSVTLSFADSGLAPQSSYRWRLTAIINGAEGPTSAEATATTRARPPRCKQPGNCPSAAAAK
jgi:hypothetical protein